MDTPSTTTAPGALRFAPLDAGAAPLERLRSDYEAALQRALAAATGGDDAASDCTLVLPHRLTTLLTHVFPRGLAALGRVAECVELTDELARVRCRTVVYVAPAQVEDVRAIATHAGLLLSVEPKERAFVLLVLGRWTPMCAEALGHQQLADVFRIEEVDAGFVPLDNDLVTLGRKRCLYDCVMQGNKSVLGDLAAALQQLQRLYAPFDHIKYKGELSAFVFQRLMEAEPGAAGDAQREERQRNEGEPSTRVRKPKRSKAKSEAAYSLVLLDRTIDLASVVSTPLTLEALVDELFESRDGFATLPPLTADSTSPAPTDQMLPLNASDSIFQRVRGLNIQAVAAALNTEASTVKQKFDHFRATSAAASTAEVHEFVKTIPQIKAKQETLERLVALTETVEATTNSRAFRAQWQLERAIMDLNHETDDVEAVFNEIEDMIFQHAPLLGVLRMLCLYSVVHGGVPRDALNRLRMRLLQTYGHELMCSFENLERVGLLREAAEPTTLLETAAGGALWGPPPPSSFMEITAALRAIDMDVDALDPGNMAFVTSGYAPISCLLVEQILKHASWEAIDNTMNKMSGPRAEVKMKHRKSTKKTTGDESGDVGTGSSARPQVLVVCFVGGVTYMEIAALRWLAQFYPSHQILIASTSMVNGHSFLQEILERIPSTT